MNVGELKKMLDKYPDDMEVINQRYSDYDLVTEDEWHVVKAVDKRGYVMRPHPTMSHENELAQKDYLLLGGN